MEKHNQSKISHREPFSVNAILPIFFYLFIIFLVVSPVVLFLFQSRGRFANVPLSLPIKTRVRFCLFITLRQSQNKNCTDFFFRSPYRFPFLFPIPFPFPFLFLLPTSADQNSVFDKNGRKVLTQSRRMVKGRSMNLLIKEEF